MQDLTAWLQWINNLTLKPIDLTLSRVQAVLKKLNLQPAGKVITVAGTNGKGSTVALLETIYLREGYKVGVYTSPYFLTYNEQIRINGVDVCDNDLMLAFHKLKAAAEHYLLTPFEFGTLVALAIFNTQQCEVIILEVGLGGRLDAVNAVESNAAIVTSIDLDHMQWLGNTREQIAYEKAGVFRAHKPAICGDLNPPRTLINYANMLQAVLFLRKRDFTLEKHPTYWHFKSNAGNFLSLPYPKLALQNMASALMAVCVLQNLLPCTRATIVHALENVSLAGRLQLISEPIQQIWDVAHNPAAVRRLQDYLRKNIISGRTLAVFSMLADKDISSCIEIISDCIDSWYIAPLPVTRGLTSAALEEIFSSLGLRWKLYVSIQEAIQEAKKDIHTNDRLLVFGSFHTVAAAMHLHPPRKARRPLPQG